MKGAKGVQTPNPTTTESSESVQTYKDRLKSNPAIISGQIGTSGYTVLSSVCNANRLEHGAKTSCELLDVEIVKTRNWEDAENKFGQENYFDAKGVLRDEHLQEFFDTFGDEVPVKSGTWFRRSVVSPIVSKGKMRIYDLGLDFSGGNVIREVYICNNGKLPYLSNGEERTPQNDSWEFSQSKPLEIDEHQAEKMKAAKSRIEYQLSL